MPSFPGSPRLLRGGLVLLDPVSGAVIRVITLQYNPDTLTRSLQILGVGAESGDRVEALRLKGPPVETIKLDAEVDATDQLEFPEQHAAAVEVGVAPQLAMLEVLVYPTTADLQRDMALSQAGRLEIAPAEQALLLFVWSKERVVPVRLTEFSITEEMFDPALNPIRARVSLGLRVLSVNDLGATHRGTALYLSYQRTKERLATRAPEATLNRLGIVSVT